MFQLDLKSRESIYEQIISQMKELIVTGVLKEGEKLPSVRELSRILTVNPNTVQKAYRELERQGYVYTVTGLGCFAASLADIRRDETAIHQLTETLRTTLRQLTYLGFTRQEIDALLDRLFREDHQHRNDTEKGSEST
ncbi:MAG: GntR family transcriptional regulator [Firmicutes bacterium]|nr:GntR family transcriptional regulator [Bacillota bacterium]